MKYVDGVGVANVSGLPPCGGSGLKYYVLYDSGKLLLRLPPCGGSGLKCRQSSVTGSWIQSPSMRREWIEIGSLLRHGHRGRKSPSMRREWIEMQDVRNDETLCGCLPPCGGSGLKWSGDRENTADRCLPPCGGSGLKCVCRRRTGGTGVSPSMRREWIEIPQTVLEVTQNGVSLHAEGVD